MAELPPIGQHTSATDLPLTENGRHQAALLGQHLRTVLHAKGHSSLADTYTHVFSSPLLRAKQTCEIVLKGAGKGDLKVVEDKDLMGKLQFVWHTRITCIIPRRGDYHITNCLRFPNNVPTYSWTRVELWRL